MTQPPLKTYLDLINDCDCVPHKIPDNLYRLYLPNDPRPHGLLLPDTVSRMPWTSDFIVSHDPPTVTLSNSIISGNDTSSTAATKISVAFAQIIDKTIGDDTFDIIHKQHSEPYLLPGALAKGCRIERFAHALFGIVARGAHLTAYTYIKSPSSESHHRGELKIWVPKRSQHLFTFPGMLDSTVAGGVKADDTPTSCILAESEEEASLPHDLVTANLKNVGVLTYITHHSSYASSTTTKTKVRKAGREKNLISPEAVYVFDLELPPDVVPKPGDDEVECFELMSVDEVKTALAAGKFKTNSAVVMIDFFVRHGIIKPSEEDSPGGEGEEDYVEIVARMHRKLPVATGPGWRD